MLAPAVPLDEAKRLATLRGLSILDTPPEERFDRLTRLAQRVFDVPITVVTLVDSNRQWFKSCQGLDATETPRSISFCGHAILGDEVFVVPDAALDPRFADNPLVTGAPHIRFYAGQPLKANNGSRLGTLCIIDTKPRQPSQADLDVLRDLAALVENELNLLDTVETTDTLLHQSAERFGAVVATLAEGVVLRDANAKIIDCNASAERIIGKTLAQMKGFVSIAPEWQTLREDGSLMPEEERPSAVAMRTGLPQSNVVVGYRKPDGSVWWGLNNARPLFEGLAGTPSGCVTSITDITERKQAESEVQRVNDLLRGSIEALKQQHGKLIESEERFRLVFEHAKVGVNVRDVEGRYVDVNPAFVEMTGYSEEELLHGSAEEITHPDDRESSAALINTLLTGGGDHYRIEKRYIRKDGSTLWADMTISAGRDDAGKLVSVIGIIQDITEKKESEELIWQQANFDTLTGLPNRRMFYDRLEQEIKKSHRSGLPMALMLLDLDRFKEVNDTLGHPQGDVLLVEAARRIAECVRESDTVARLGGDEFTVILSELKDVNSVERIAQKIIESLAAPFQLLQETAHVSASVGITLYPDDSQDVDVLIKNADQAMYLSKHLGRNRFSYFTKALQEAAQTRLRLLSDLRGALPGKQLAVYYQPIVDMATGKIYKAEALLRWQHPERGIVSPMQFIPMAEKLGLIHEIGDWVFREAARELKRWRDLFGPEFQVSLNVSPVQFRQHWADHASSWLSHLRAMDLPGQSLVIEITEGLLLNAEINVTEKLLAFRDVSVQVALDDFGTGYSSLSYLKKFDIDYLKIDQSFVRNLEEDQNDRTLCGAIIVMAHKLGLKVIAEGVETEQQRVLLAAYGCDYAQGWLYSKAVPSEQFELLLLEQVK